jgi:hypothetical protein
MFEKFKKANYYINAMSIYEIKSNEMNNQSIANNPSSSSNNEEEPIYLSSSSDDDNDVNSTVNDYATSTKSSESLSPSSLAKRKIYDEYDPENLDDNAYESYSSNKEYLKNKATKSGFKTKLSEEDNSESDSLNSNESEQTSTSSSSDNDSDETSKRKLSSESIKSHSKPFNKTISLSTKSSPNDKLTHKANLDSEQNKQIAKKHHSSQVSSPKSTKLNNSTDSLIKLKKSTSVDSNKEAAQNKPSSNSVISGKIINLSSGFKIPKRPR